MPLRLSIMTFRTTHCQVYRNTYLLLQMMKKTTTKYFYHFIYSLLKVRGDGRGYESVGVKGWSCLVLFTSFMNCMIIIWNRYFIYYIYFRIMADYKSLSTWTGWQEEERIVGVRSEIGPTKGVAGANEAAVASTAAVIFFVLLLVSYLPDKPQSLLFQHLFAILKATQYSGPSVFFFSCE